MESLESKLDRLTPVQRKEVESFVDFLLSRTTGVPVSMDHGSEVPSAPQYVVPPPMILHEPPTITGSLRSDDQFSITRDEPAHSGFPPPPERDEEVIQVITAGGSDWVTRDYLDYGKFEEKSPQAPSPAAEAVQRIKKKLGDKKQPEPGKHILEWID